MTFKLKKDIVIPAGTRFDTAPTKTKRVGGGHIQAVFGLSRNTHGFIEYSLDGETDLEEMRDYFEVCD